MKVPTTTEERRARLFQPALLTSVIEPLLVGELLARELGRDHPDAPRVLWRLAELRVRVDPLAVLRAADHLPAPPTQELGDRVRAEALFAVGELDAAGTLLDAHGDEGGPWDVLGALRELGRGDVAAAKSLLDRALDSELDLEWRATALLHRIDVHGRRKDSAAVEQDAIALRELLLAHGAFTSAAIAQLTAGINATDFRDGLIREYWAERSRRTREALIEGIEEDQAAVMPVPLHVHAAFRKHGREPKKVEDSLFAIGGLQYRAGQRNEAYATFFYAKGIAARAFPPAVAKRFAEALDAFVDILGEEAAIEAAKYIELRVATFRSTMRPRDRDED